jgi:hypothetical protein
MARTWLLVGIITSNALFGRGLDVAPNAAPERRLPGGATEQGSNRITFLHYGPIVARMQQLAAEAPELVEVWTAQDRYGVASPGTCKDVRQQDTPCKQWFFTLTNRTSQQPGASSVVAGDPRVAAQRPHVFFSGNLHGDEVVGPMTLIYLAEHLVHSALGTNGAALQDWASHILNHRRVIMVPITNPWG